MAGTPCASSGPVKATTALSALNSVLAGLKPEMALVNAVQMLQDHGLSGAPVVDEGGRPIGVLSEERLLRFLVQDAYARAAESTVGDAMTSPAPCVHADTPLTVVAERMVDANTSCVLVLNEQEILVGQVNREDLVDAMLELVHGEHGSARFVGKHDNPVQEGALAGGAKPRTSVRDAVGTETDEVYRHALEAGQPKEGGGQPEDYPYPGHRRDPHPPTEKPAGRS